MIWDCHQVVLISYERLSFAVAKTVFLTLFVEIIRLIGWGFVVREGRDMVELYKAVEQLKEDFQDSPF